MLRILRHHKVAFETSPQTHCDQSTVEKWMCANANGAGDIDDVSVLCFGRTIAVANVSQAYIIAALFAADHNDYVDKNLSYPFESRVCTSPRKECDAEPESLYSEREDPYETLEMWKVEDVDYELNEDLTVNNFGPTRAHENRFSDM
jgi:hypothetical protein